MLEKCNVLFNSVFHMQLPATTKAAEHQVQDIESIKAAERSEREM